MNRAQKMAKFTVVVIAASCILSGVAVLVGYFLVGVPKAYAGLAFMGISGLAGLAPLIYKKERARVTFDERDHMINRRAALVGFAAAYLVMGLACMLPFFVLGPRASVSVGNLPLIFMGGGLSHYFAYSLAILLQYGKEGANG